jgi:hypothetical protein
VPTGLSATAGDHEGEIDLTWDTVKGAKSYVLERSPDPPTANSDTGSHCHQVFGDRRWLIERHALLVPRGGRHQCRTERLERPSS